MWINGAPTFGMMAWGNKASQASSSLSGMLSHQQKQCLAQDAPWLCRARAVLGLGLLLAEGTGMGGVTLQASAFPEITLELSWKEQGSDRGWQSPVRAQSKPSVVRTRTQPRIKQRTPD